jgi:hypothetical protein
MIPQKLPHARPSKWRAKWIWPSMAPANESNVYCYFRKTFDLEQGPEGHSLFVSANRRSTMRRFSRARSPGKTWVWI